MGANQSASADQEAWKATRALEEQERTRREVEGNPLPSENLIRVQEDLLHTISVKAANEAEAIAFQEREAARNLQFVKDELLSKADRKLAAQLEGEEQVRRVAEEHQHDVRQELLSKHDLKIVKKLEEEERTTRITEELHHDVNQQFLSMVDLQACKALEERERIERLCVPHRPSDAMIHVQEDILHVVNSRKVDEAEGIEQEERCFEEALTEFTAQIASDCDREIVGVLESAECSRRIMEGIPLDEESTRRLVEERHQDVNEELLSKADLTSCKQMEEQERARRLAEAVPMSEAALLLQEDAIRKVNAKEASRAEEIARDEQVTDMVRHVVCEQVRSVCDRKAIAVMEEEERSRRMIEEHQHDVNQELLSKADLRACRQMEEEERARRDSQPAPALTEAMATIQEAVVRRIDSRIAIEAENVARAEQVAEMQRHEVCEEVRSVVHRKSAALLMEEERTRRISVDRQRDVNAELLSKADLESVKVMEEEERQYRLQYDVGTVACSSQAAAALREEMMRRVGPQSA